MPSKPCKDHLGNKYPSIKSMCEHWKVHPMTYRIRTTKYNWSVEKALTTPMITNTYTPANTLRITTHTGANINYKTDWGTATSAFHDWKRKLETLDVHIIDFIQIKNVELINKNGIIEDSWLNLEPVWKKLEKYQDFTEIEPTSFNVLFKDRDFKTVQIHSVKPLKKNSNDIIGFLGSVSWIKNELKSSNVYIYHPEMFIYGYKETNKALDILIKDW